MIRIVGFGYIFAFFIAMCAPALAQPADVSLQNTFTANGNWFQNQTLFGISGPLGGVLNVMGSGINSNVLYGRGAGSPTSLSNAPVTITLEDYSVAHSGLLDFRAVDSAGTVHGQAAGLNPGFISWDAGHMQTDWDFNGYRNGQFEGMLQLYSGCQAAYNNNGHGPGCAVDEHPHLAPAKPFLYNLGGIQGGGAGQRWLTIYGMNLDLGTNRNDIHPKLTFSNAANAPIGIIDAQTDGSGMSYDAYGHFFKTGGVVVGGYTHQGPATVNAGAYFVGDQSGVTCSGASTSAFRVVGGIVTHC